LFLHPYLLGKGWAKSFKIKTTSLVFRKQFLNVSCFLHFWQQFFFFSATCNQLSVFSGQLSEKDRKNSEQLATGSEQERQG